jgi:hypothetical protein
VDFLENHMTWAGDSETRSPGPQINTEPSAEMHEGWIEGAVSQTIARAIYDATHSPDPALRQEAASWLLICCPDIAEQVALPDLQVDAMAELASTYVMAEKATAA